MNKTQLKLLIGVAIISGLIGIAYFGAQYYINNKTQEINMGLVVQKLVIGIGAEVAQVPVMVVSDPIPNAFAVNESGIHRIEITDGMLALVENNDQLAIILAHEYGHILMGHTTGDYDEYIPVFYQEKYADYMSLSIAKQSGFDICEGAKVFKVIHEKMDKSTDGTGDHPETLNRYKYLSRGC